MRQTLLSLGLPVLLLLLLGIEYHELLLAPDQVQTEPLWYWLMSLLSVGVILFWPSQEPRFAQRLASYHRPLKWVSYLSFALLAGLFCYCFADFVERFPLSEIYSELLENTRTQAERVSLGLDPYFKVDQIWNGVYPVYMAGKWLVYAPSYFLSIDLRWMDVCMTLLGLGLLWHRSAKQGPYACLLLLASLLPLAWLGHYLLFVNTWFLRASGEGISLGWYLLLVWGLLERRYTWQGFVIVMILLSRPGLVCWLPVWIFCLWRYDGRAAFYRLLVGLIVSLSIFLILPFRWSGLSYFSDWPQAYLEYAKTYLHPDRQAWFINVPAYALRFGADRLGWLPGLQIGLGSLMSLGVIGLWKRFVGRKRSLPLVGVLSLKLCLLFYVIFHLTPFQDFFIIVSVLSIVLFWQIASPAFRGQSFSEAVSLPRLQLSSGQRKNLLLAASLLLLVTLEVLCNTRFISAPFTANFRWASALYFAAGLGIVALILIRPAEVRLPALLPRPNAQGVSWFKWGMALVIGFFFLRAGDWILTAHPLTIDDADMLPILREQARRFLQGEDVYAIMPGVWKGNMRPIYMPGFWAPFVPFEWAGVDIRWATLVILTISLGLIIWQLPLRRRNQSVFVLLAMVPLVLLYEAIWIGEGGIIRLAEEGIIMGYYVLLGSAVYRRWPILVGVAIALCCLSRFALVPWMGFYLLYVFFFESRRHAIISAGVAGAIGLFCFLIPYGFELWDYFFNHPHRYQKFAENTWEVNQEFYANTLGLAKYLSQSLVRYQHRAHIILSFSAPATLLLVYWRTRHRWAWHQDFVALAMLKLTLVIFYNFIVMPVFYLFFVNTILSCLILFAYLGKVLRLDDWAGTVN